MNEVVGRETIILPTSHSPSQPLCHGPSRTAHPRIQGPSPSAATGPGRARGVAHGISVAFCTGSTTSCARGSRGGTCRAASGTGTASFAAIGAGAWPGSGNGWQPACAEERAQPCRVHLDTTHVRSHPVSAGARRAQGGPDAQAQGRSRGGFGTKLHVLVDAQGGLLACCLTPGQAHDRPQAEGLLEGVRPDYVLADRSYDDDELRLYIVAQGAEPVIPGRRNRRQCRSTTTGCCTGSATSWNGPSAGSSRADAWASGRVTLSHTHTIWRGRSCVGAGHGTGSSSCCIPVAAPCGTAGGQPGPMLARCPAAVPTFPLNQIGRYDRQGPLPA